MNSTPCSAFYSYPVLQPCRATLLPAQAPLPATMQNPQVQGGMPVAMENETFVLRRQGIAFSAKSGRVKVDGSGVLFLSTLRMVFVADKGQHFDMPLATLYEEKFNQPIFGANNLTGTSPPLDGLPDNYTWCISSAMEAWSTLLALLLPPARGNAHAHATSVGSGGPGGADPRYRRAGPRAGRLRGSERPNYLLHFRPGKVGEIIMLLRLATR